MSEEVAITSPIPHDLRGAFNIASVSASFYTAYRNQTIRSPMRTLRQAAFRVTIGATMLLPCIGHAQSLAAAQSAFMAQHFAQADSLLRAVRRNDPLREDRQVATLLLSTILWRVRSDSVAANVYLDSLRDLAAPRDTTVARVFVERSRMELSFGNATEARRAARAALSVAATAPEDSPVQTDAIVAFGNAVLEPYRACATRDTPVHSARECANVPGTDVVRQLHTTLRQRVRASPGALDIAGLLMQSASLLRDRDALRIGWESYYLTSLDSAASGTILRTAHRAVRSESSWAALVRALASSAVLDAAVLTTLAPDGSHRADAAADAAERLRPYAAYCRAVRRMTEDHYRNVANTRVGDTTQWLNALDSLTRRVAAQYSGVPPASLTADSAARVLQRVFGVRINTGPTAGVRDLHMGHAVINEHWTVVQYGHSATVHFIALDGMVSNGYQSWAWDGRAAHGGWSTDSTIVQVRSVYARGPQRTWRELADSAAARAAAMTLARDSASDILHAERSQSGYFPGVQARLTRDGEREVLAALRRKGYRGPDLERQFKATYAAAMLQSSIVAHEGRHAIDATLHLPLTSAEREFRAKLSEVAFATVPRLALGSILNATTGDDTPHGIANGRLLGVLEHWIDAHRNQLPETPGTLNAPAVLLIPQLSDLQLRAITRLADPLAR